MERKLSDLIGIKPITMIIGNWMHQVQTCVFRYNNLTDIESLKRNYLLEWEDYSSIFDILYFSLTENGFVCRIKLKSNIDINERELEFNNNTVAAFYFSDK